MPIRKDIDVVVEVKAKVMVKCCFQFGLGNEEKVWFGGREVAAGWQTTLQKVAEDRRTKAGQTTLQ